jgi:hypothetical protein
VKTLIFKLSKACYIIKSLKEVMIPHAMKGIKFFKGSHDATSHKVLLFTPCHAHLMHGLIFLDLGDI